MLPRFVPTFDYRDAELAVVVSVSWAGRTWRLSGREITGVDMHADPGLVEIPDISDEISIEPGGDSGVTVPIAVVLPAIDVRSYVDDGYDLIDLTAEIALVWHRNGILLHEWAAREVFADGDADEPQQGDPTQPSGTITCSIEDSPYRQIRPISLRTWEVSEETWAGSPEIGARYPLTLGTPDPDSLGDGPPAPVIEQSGVPENTTALVTVGWAAASRVTVRDSDDTTDVLDISYQLDGLGQLVATVDLVGSALNVADGTTYTTSWTEGAALKPFGGTGPVHLAAYLLALGGADIDLPEWIRIAELTGLSAGGYVDDPESEAWEVARDLLTGLPLSSRRDRDGWVPVSLDPHLASLVSVETWRESGPWRRTSAWTMTGTSRVTRSEVTSPASEITVGATDARDAALPHAWVRHLPRQSESSISPAWSWSETLDRRVLSYQARSQAMGWEAASFDVPPQWGQAKAGEWIFLAEDDRHAIVLRRTLTDGVWDYTLARPVGMIS